MDKRNIAHDLTMLYLDNQNLSGLTPEQLLVKYEATYNAICNHYTDKHKSDWKYLLMNKHGYFVTISNKISSE